MKSQSNLLYTKTRDWGILLIWAVALPAKAFRILFMQPLRLSRKGLWLERTDFKLDLTGLVVSDHR